MDSRSCSSSQVVNLHNNEGGHNNKRKRKSTSDDKNIENHRPPHKRICHTTQPLQQQQQSQAPPAPPQTPSANSNGAGGTVGGGGGGGGYASDSHSSSDFTPDFDLLGSPQSINNILSPIIDSPKKKLIGGGRGDSTPHHHHHHKKQVLGSFDDNLPCNCIIAPSSELRLCPLPPLAWAEASDVWKFMCIKDDKGSLERKPTMLNNHPGILPRMRAILLDWLIEVCEVYKLHRETYYLAVDYLDRFLEVTSNISKTCLQLIGITCLFVAAKIEEIYPPKIGEFAYVTDGACQEEDIIKQEIVLLTALDWSIHPVTIIGWLSVYMQLKVNNRTPPITTTAASNVNNKLYVDKLGEAFVYPQFSGWEFVQTAQLIDLCTLDLGIANFPYSVIAAAALCHTSSRSTALRVSGLDWSVVGPCVKWMDPFFQVVREVAPQLQLLEQDETIKPSYGLNHICPNIVTDDSHIIQTHSTSLSLFDKALVRREKDKILKQLESPAQTGASVTCPEGLLTPPASNQKFIGSDNLDTEREKTITKTSY